jgi:hypothetical protein
VLNCESLALAIEECQQSVKVDIYIYIYNYTTNEAQLHSRSGRTSGILDPFQCNQSTKLDHTTAVHESFQIVPLCHAPKHPYSTGLKSERTEAVT